MKIAQILWNKAHWIFDTDETMDQLKARFASDIVFVNITNLNPQPQEGWEYDGSNFTAPVVSAPTVNDINAQYLPQFQTLQQSYTAAILTNNTAGQAAIQQAYQALQTQYNRAMEAIQS